MTWTALQIRNVRHLRENGHTQREIAAAIGTTESAIINICRQYQITGHAPHPGTDPTPAEGALLPLLDRYPHDYTDPKARVRRAELDRRQRA